MAAIFLTERERLYKCRL